MKISIKQCMQATPAIIDQVFVHINMYLKRSVHNNHLVPFKVYGFDCKLIFINDVDQGIKIGLNIGNISHIDFIIKKEDVEIGVVNIEHVKEYVNEQMFKIITRLFYQLFTYDKINDLVKEYGECDYGDISHLFNKHYPSIEVQKRTNGYRYYTWVGIPKADEATLRFENIVQNSMFMPLSDIGEVSIFDKESTTFEMSNVISNRPIEIPAEQVYYACKVIDNFCYDLTFLCMKGEYKPEWLNTMVSI